MTQWCWCQFSIQIRVCNDPGCVWCGTKRSGTGSAACGGNTKRETLPSWQSFHRRGHPALSNYCALRCSVLDSLQMLSLSHQGWLPTSTCLDARRLAPPERVWVCWLKGNYQTAVLLDFTLYRLVNCVCYVWFSKLMSTASWLVSCVSATYNVEPTLHSNESKVLALFVVPTHSAIYCIQLTCYVSIILVSD